MCSTFLFTQLEISMSIKLNKSALVVAMTAGALMSSNALSQKTPNVLILWGDDIGQFNISAYNHGMMGYKTPNIDSIAKQGALFTDWYGSKVVLLVAPHLLPVNLRFVQA
jgi:hypothetical protein